MVLCLSHDGACTDSFENFLENSLKGDLSNDITLNPPLISLVNTFNVFLASNILLKCKANSYTHIFQVLNIKKTF